MSLSEKDFFDILSINPSSRNYQILKAIIEVTEEKGKAPDFSEIELKVNCNREEPFSKQWIYKCLSDLKDQEMITVDNINKPTTYSASVINLRSGLARLQQDKLKELAIRRKNLEQEIKEIEDQSLYDLAYYFVDSLSGKRVERRSGVIEGIENIRRFILLEIIEQSKAGDIIRANSRINFVDNLAQELVSLERVLLETVQKGVKIKALLAHHSLVEAYEASDLSELFRREQDLFKKAIANDLIDIRAPRDNLMPYRIISLNNDKMFMFLADTANPDTVALIFREGNPSMVDSAIEKFDRIFAEGEELNATVLEEIERML
ncbi:MAG: hypothetical protein ACFFED_17380 [Candidatus Thorarchaeota archaeon]